MRKFLSKRTTKGKNEVIKKEPGAKEPQKLEGQKNCLGSSESKAEQLVTSCWLQGWAEQHWQLQCTGFTTWVENHLCDLVYDSGRIFMHCQAAKWCEQVILNTLLLWLSWVAKVHSAGPMLSGSNHTLSLLWCSQLTSVILISCCFQLGWLKRLNRDRQL